LIEKSLDNVEWDFKRVSDLIQTINDYYVENKHDLMADIFHALLLNWNIIDKEILITLRNWSLKG